MKRSSKYHKAIAENGHYSGYSMPVNPEPNELTVRDHIRRYSLWRIGHLELCSPTSAIASSLEGDYSRGAVLVTSESSSFRLPWLHN
jgi:hypothetical protein